MGKKILIAMSGISVFWMIGYTLYMYYSDRLEKQGLMENGLIIFPPCIALIHFLLMVKICSNPYKTGIPDEMPEENREAFLQHKHFMGYFYSFANIIFLLCAQFTIVDELKGALPLIIFLLLAICTVAIFDASKTARLKQQ
jgi:hypothetical protein